MELREQPSFKKDIVSKVLRKNSGEIDRLKILSKFAKNRHSIIEKHGYDLFKAYYSNKEEAIVNHI